MLDLLSLQTRPPREIVWYFAILLSSYTYKGHGPLKICLWTPGFPWTPGWEPQAYCNNFCWIKPTCMNLRSIVMWQCKMSVTGRHCRPAHDFSYSSKQAGLC